MKKDLPLYIYGSIILLVGIGLLIPISNNFEFIQLFLGLSLIVGAVFAFITAIRHQKKLVQLTYHEMHAFILLVYGISILFFCSTLENIYTFTLFLFVFYTFSEIIFCSWLYNRGESVVIKILVVRIFLALFTGIGAVVALQYSAFTLQLFGVLFIAVGINTLLYFPVMKGHEKKLIPKNL